MPTYPFDRKRYWIGEDEHRTDEPTGMGGELRRLARTDKKALRRELGFLVRSHAAAVLAHPSLDERDMRQTFKDLGFDSQGSLELRNRLGTATGLALPASLLYDFPTGRELVARLATGLRESPEPEPVAEKAAPAGANGGSATAPAADGPEPIAVVAMACRYPGEIASPEDLWRLVAEGRDAVTEFPADRDWDPDLYDPDPRRPGKSAVRHGGFLHDAGDFDAAFFGISPREAQAMDPQQRLLLETSWESLERAGIDARSLHGSRTGVFIGAMASDYGPRMHDAPEGAEGHLLTGNTASVMSGRISYQLGLTGPAVTVDTACSSSLSALHLAIRSLRSGESDLALAGGVTVMSTPGIFVEFSRQDGLAPDGRCKPFAAAADGTAWAEGVGILLVERLSDAERLGHPVLAVVRGSAVNQDGASNGLTAPNGPSQQRVIRQALADAGLGTRDVDAVEAHGTGTRLGDPIEAEAILATYGQDRDAARPVLLGSLKSNIGHAQAAAGVGGVIKMVQALRHGVLPPSLGVDRPTPHVDWSSGAVELVRETREWPLTGRPRRAAVSSFGISGTNAHVVLEEYARPATDPAPETDANPDTADAAEPAAGPEGDGAGTETAAAAPVPWLISARDETALRAQAARLREVLAGRPDFSPADVGRTLATGRTLFEHRAAVVAGEPAEYLAALDALARGAEAPGLVTGGTADAGTTAYLFSGHGTARAGMGRALHGAFPVFAAALDAVLAELDADTAPPVRELLLADGPGDPGTPPPSRYALPALFAFQTALYRLLETTGPEPEAVVGHSVGSFAAAHAAGVLSLRDATGLAAAYGALVDTAAVDGAMAVVGAGEREIGLTLADHPGDLALASVDGPDRVVVSGTADVVEFVTAGWAAQGHEIRTLPVGQAFHSPLHDDIAGRFHALAAELTFHTPRIPVHSAVTGLPATGRDLGSADFWTRQIHGTVRLHDTIGKLRADGVTGVLEIGPDGSHSAALDRAFDDGPAVAIPLLTGAGPDARDLVTALARAQVLGLGGDPAALTPGTGRTELPTYAFQRRRYWLTAGGGATGGTAGRSAHPLITSAVDLAGRDATVLTSRLSLTGQPWLADHEVGGTVLLPATAFLELALAAGRLTGAELLVDLTLEAPLALAGSDQARLQIEVEAPGADGRRAFTVHSRPEGTSADDEPGPWVRHATGVLGPAASGTPEGLGEWPPADTTAVPLTDAYPRLADGGYGYGPVFRGLRALWRRPDGTLFAEIGTDGEDQGGADRYGLHPALLDAALHPLVLAGLDAVGEDRIALPFSWAGARIHAVGATALRVRLTPKQGGGFAVLAADATGEPVATVDTLTLRPVERAKLGAARADRGAALLRLEWQPVERPVEAPETTGPAWTEITDGDDLAAVAAGTGVLRVTCRADGDPYDIETAHATAGRTLDLLRRFVSDPRLSDTRLLLVTRGAVAAGTGDDITDLAAATVWGMARTAQSEHPGRITVVDLDPATTADDPLAAAVATGEPQLAVRDGALLVPRLVRTEDDGRDEGPAWDPDGTVLITGGTGGLGALFARHLVTRYGVRRLLLCSRRGEDAAGARELAAELTGLGARVRIEARDVADRAEVAALLAEIPDEHPLTAVVHTAGVLADATLTALTGEQLTRVLRPKADAAWHLHDLTRDGKLAAFVLFSSVSGLIGTPGQANYAAANTYLDALAAHRAATGLAATSQAWGLWDGTHGLGGTLGRADLARWAGAGITPITPEQGLALFDAALTTGDALTVPTALNTTARTGDPAAQPAPLRGLVRVRAPRAARATSAAGRTADSWAGRMAALPPGKRRGALLDVVRTHIAEVMGYPDPQAVESGRAFQELGFDSLTAVELRNRLNAVTGLVLPSTVAFDHPSADALAGYLDGEISTGEPEPAPAAPDPAFDGLADRIRSIASDADAWSTVSARLRELLELAGGGARRGLDTASDGELFALVDGAE
ncbi:type I polyketide synthase [Streptomyces sp. NPDC020875]|uniref:type I polyketide synthase n=1 Tax=Streptomyces sp. NPDC020875 TaxID=3154898 RepID=UPI00340A4D84